MSQPPPCGRATPRWSAAGQFVADAASIAGLPASSACVRVGPPFSASAPSFGSMAVALGVTFPTLLPLVLVMLLPVPLPTRVKLAENDPRASGAVGAVFFATRLLLRMTPLPLSEPSFCRIPPPPLLAELNAMVLFVIVFLAPPTSSELSIPPPEAAEFPETVLLVSVSEELSRPKGSLTVLKMPPPRPAAELFMMVLLRMVRLPAKLLTPPPSPVVEFPMTVLRLSVTFPCPREMPPLRLSTTLAWVSSVNPRFAAMPQPELPTTLLLVSLRVPPSLKMPQSELCPTVVVESVAMKLLWLKIPRPELLAMVPCTMVSGPWLSIPPAALNAAVAEFPETALLVRVNEP